MTARARHRRAWWRAHRERSGAARCTGRGGRRSATPAGLGRRPQKPPGGVSYAAIGRPGLSVPARAAPCPP
eukprot:4213631-Lingulodinium_polyedra.AAC.1